MRSSSALLALLGLLVASPAAAIERQHHIGIAPMGAILDVDSKSTMSVGAGGAVHYAYGLTDQWNFTADASSAVVARDQKRDTPTTPRDRPATVDQVAVGASYVIDILRWVPWAGVEGGVYRLAGGALDDALFIAGGSIGIGVDYQLSRSFAIGVCGRQHFLLSKLDAYPSYTTASLRFEYMWGY